MDSNLREAERAYHLDPNDLRKKILYLSALNRSVGGCVIQPVVCDHRTSDCGDSCDTYTGAVPPHIGEAHQSLTSLDGFFDYFVLNSICLDTINFRNQENLLEVSRDIVQHFHECSRPSNSIFPIWNPQINFSVLGDNSYGVELATNGNNPYAFIVGEAFVVPKDKAQLFDDIFYQSLAHFVNEEQLRSRGRRSRRRSSASPSLPASLRGAIASLLVARKTSYRLAAIARYAVNDIEFA